MSNIRKLRLFRLADDGKRIPCIFEIDDQQTILKEYHDVTALNHVAAGRDPFVNNEPPERRKALAMARWVTENVTENSIPGTDEMRSRYFAEKAAMIAQHQTEGHTCPPCEIGKLMRRFRDELEKSGLLV